MRDEAQVFGINFSSKLVNIIIWKREKGSFSSSGDVLWLQSAVSTEDTRDKLFTTEKKSNNLNSSKRKLYQKQRLEALANQNFGLLRKSSVCWLKPWRRRARYFWVQASLYSDITWYNPSSTNFFSRKVVRLSLNYFTWAVTLKMSSNYPPDLTPEQACYLLSNLKDWSILNGLAVRPSSTYISKDVDPSGSIAIPAPVTLFPSIFPRSCFNEASNIQQAFNELYAAIAADEEWLTEVIQEWESPSSLPSLTLEVSSSLF